MDETFPVGRKAVTPEAEGLRKRQYGVEVKVRAYTLALDMNSSSEPVKGGDLVISSGDNICINKLINFADMKPTTSLNGMSI